MSTSCKLARQASSLYVLVHALCSSMLLSNLMVYSPIDTLPTEPLTRSWLKLMYVHHKWICSFLRRPGSPALGAEVSSDGEDDEGSVSYYRKRAMDPVWEVEGVKATLTLLEAAYILLQQKREGRSRNNYFER